MLGRHQAIGAVAPALFLALGLPVAGVALARQLAVHRLDVEVMRYERRETSTERMRAEVAAAATCRRFCPAELSLLTAIAEIDITDQDVSARSTTLAAARRAAHAVLAERPGWGPGLAIAAAAEQASGNNQAAIGLYARSYEATPYLRAQALWRLRFAAANWPQLGASTRDAALREAEWMAGLGWADKQAVVQALGNSPAAVRFAMVTAAPDDPPS